MKKLLLVLAILVFVLPLLPAQTDALTAECEQARWAGGHHAGFNHQCLISMIDSFDDGYGDGGGLDGWR